MGMRSAEFGVLQHTDMFLHTISYTARNTTVYAVSNHVETSSIVVVQNSAGQDRQDTPAWESSEIPRYYSNGCFFDM
jgi:hypothetical protein